VFENELEAANLCKAGTCEFIRGMHHLGEAARLCKASICEFIRGMHFFFVVLQLK
jgi:hypothetical protein